MIKCFKDIILFVVDFYSLFHIFSRGRGRTQLSMLPRAIARSGNKNVPNSSPSLQNGQKSDSTDSGSEAKPLSNSDFADMLKK